METRMRFFEMHLSAAQFVMVRALLVVALLCIATGSSESVHGRVWKMGILAFQGRDVAIERWTETFQNYLNVAAVPCLSSKGIQNSSFEMVPVGWLEDPMAMLRARLLDFYFTQAGQFVCFSLEIPLEPVVTLKNLRAGEEVEVYGGLVVTAANRSDMNQFNDLRHKIISAVNPSGLGGFQMQWAHIEEASQIMLIRDAKMLQFTGSQIKSLQDVKSGIVDVAFVRSDMLKIAESKGAVNESDFKVIEPTSYSGYPFSSTTPLYPEWSLGVQDWVPSDVKKCVSLALMNIEKEDLAATTGKYSSFVTPKSMQSISSLQSRLGLYLSSPFGHAERCLRSDELQGTVPCPKGYTSITEHEEGQLCARQGLSCPDDVLLCICGPCKQNENGTASNTALGITRGQYIGSAVGLGILALALTAFLVSIFCWERRKKHRALWIKWEALGVPDQPQIVGVEMYGVALKGSYRGMDVAIKIYNPPGTAESWESGDWARVNGGQVRQLLLTRVNAGKSTRWRYKKLDQRSRVGPCSIIPVSSMAESSRTKGYEDGLESGHLSTQRGPGSHDTLPTHFSKEGEYQDEEDDALVTKRILSRTRRTRLQHPRIVSVLGLCRDAPCRGLMVVMELMENGNLYSLLLNTTVPLALLTKVTVMQDVAVGLNYMHTSNPPIIYERLKAGNVLIDQNFRAKICDFRFVNAVSIDTADDKYWAAPETLRGGALTRASNAFSFGILMSTILSRSEPHGKCVGNHTADSMKRVAESNMLEDDISRLIEQCCNENPSNRPSFPTIISKLSKILEKCRKDSSRSSVQNKQKLLLDIFPEKVAAALSSGRPVEPEPFDCVTIFFSDVVGFTKISSALEAREVMDMLHRLYKAFDSLTTKYGLFKVETIGDAYMVVANLPNPQARHTLRIAQFAIEAVRVAETVPIHKDQSELGFVNIRVGFHSGPVVASVIGTKNPRYCLFGETVNIASRMESSSLPGRIQCSEYSATLLKCQSPEIELEERGSHHVKGLGMTNTYWVRF